MKKCWYIVLLVLYTTSCITPSRLGMNYKGQHIYTSSTKAVENQNIVLTVNSLTKEDVGYDVKGLQNRFVSYIYKNPILANLIQKYPDLKIDIEIFPSEKIKRTWILDAAFFYPGCGALLPYTPWWGSTDLLANMTITIPNIASDEYKFNSSEPFKINFYPYYNAGRVLTEKYSAAYNKLFDLIGKFNFNELAEKAKIQSTSSFQYDRRYSFNHKSDVDNDIPDLGLNNQNRFALIIGNEDYASQQTELKSEINVDFARNDASAFEEYATKILGIPKENITLLLDATTGKMKQSLDKLSLLAKNSYGNAEIFFYYAGHGLPDDITKEPYLVPVDVSGNNISNGIRLMDVYSKLTEYPCKRITVFLDACFSGGARSQGLIAARGVKIRPKTSVLKGNLVVFSASSEEQSSLGYKDKEHGFFTYFLLQKLKETKGKISYLELSDYLTRQVGLKSVSINDKEQNPQTNVSPDVIEIWQTWKFE